MLIGVAIGFAVGILPGLGGPTTLALMLPFVLKMTPVEAFAFLLGMLAVTNTAGDITSILFGIPGEPTSAATIVDGHAMAKKGEAGRALGAAMMSSLVGAVFGALDDQFESCFDFAGVVAVAEDELGAAEDAGEGVVYVMGDAE